MFSWKGPNTTGDCSRDQNAAAIDWSGLRDLFGLKKQTPIYHNTDQAGAKINETVAAGAIPVPIDGSIKTIK